MPPSDRFELSQIEFPAFVTVYAPEHVCNGTPVASYFACGICRDESEVRPMIDFYTGAGVTLQVYVALNPTSEFRLRIGRKL